MNVLGRAAAAAGCLLLATAGVQAADRSIVVLDASGSMWGQIDGRAKIEIARETLRDVLGAVPPGNEIGLMVYGHRTKGACDDIELAIEPAAGTAEAISSFAAKLNPKGKTPLTGAVEAAAKALRSTEEKATVVLVTDGLETCDGDPCALARALESSGVDFTTHVVGFGLSAEEGKQVACLAEETGGKYFDAKDAGSLNEALQGTIAKVEAVEEKPAAPAEEKPAADPAKNVVAKAYLYEGGPALEDNNDVRWDFYPLAEDGSRSAEAADGTYGGVQSFALKPGSYVAVARLGALTNEEVVDVAADGSTATTEIIFDAGILEVTPLFTENGPETGSDARIDMRFNGGEDGGYGPVKVYAGAGLVEIHGRIAEARVKKDVQVEAGKTTKTTIVIPAGTVVANAAFATGGTKVESGDIRFDILAATAAPDGDRKNFNGGYGPDNRMFVPEGDYTLVARLGQATAEVPVSVKAGQATEASVILNAGVLAIAAPGAYRIDIRTVKNISGDQKDMSGNYGTEHQETLPPGDYEVVVTYEGRDEKKIAKATVSADKRTEITVE